MKQRPQKVFPREYTAIDLNIVHVVSITDDKASDNELDDETTAGRTFPITSLHQRSDYTPDLSNPNQLADQTLRMIALTLLLCASAYEDVSD